MQQIKKNVIIEHLSPVPSPSNNCPVCPVCPGQSNPPSQSHSSRSQNSTSSSQSSTSRSQNSTPPLSTTSQTELNDCYGEIGTSSTAPCICPDGKTWKQISGSRSSKLLYGCIK
jgi:hypothetical protein